MIIRNAKLGDNIQILHLVERLSSYLTFNIFPLFKETYNIDRCIVSEEENKVLGVSTWREMRRKEIVTNWTLVHEQYQGKGIGSNLFSNRLQVLINQGAKVIKTDVVSQSLVVWHEKRGFVKWSRISFPGKKNQFGDLGYYQRMRKQV